jgi:pimeloyl-ACP methyl ester carboxylesterase
MPCVMLEQPATGVVELLPDLKPANQPRTVWLQAVGVPTTYSLLYLHGFTASPGEAADIPEQMARALRANLYVHRWPGHGMASPNAMQGLSVESLQRSAHEALDTARCMGTTVVIVGSSLGATLGLWLASVRPQEVAAVVAWSPGVRAFDEALLAKFCEAQDPLTDPRPRSQDVLAYWSQTIHPDGFRALRDVFRAFALHPPWPGVRCPVFLGYYRNPDGTEDQTASVPAMLEMFDALGTPSHQKAAVAFPASSHVIGSPYKSAVSDRVMQASLDLLVSHLPPQDAADSAG